MKLINSEAGLVCKTVHTSLSSPFSYFISYICEACGDWGLRGRYFRKCPFLWVEKHASQAVCSLEPRGPPMTLANTGLLRKWKNSSSQRGYVPGFSTLQWWKIWLAWQFNAFLTWTYIDCALTAKKCTIDPIPKNANAIIDTQYIEAL